MNVRELIFQLLDLPMEAEVRYWAGASWLQSITAAETYCVRVEDDSLVVVIR